VAVAADAIVPAYAIGWDVGGWNCDSNGKSRDALAILAPDGSLLGTPWRGNLREQINQATTAAAWVAALFALCALSPPPAPQRIIMGIDTPLGFSLPFHALLTGTAMAAPIGDSAANPYLFRQTEQYLFAHGLKPLSAIKDMIGSQATKGLHVLAKFAPQAVACGVWQDASSGFTALEAYPSACKHSSLIQQLRRAYPALGHADKDDALICALIARLYDQQQFNPQQAALMPPPSAMPMAEGWIWVPRDALP
jgi:hypothetical protein